MMSCVPVPVPIPAGTFNRAYRAGTQTLGAATKEWLSLPKLALAVAIGSALYAWPTPAKTLAKTQGGAGVPQTKYAMPGMEMWVDRPLNTLLKDQSLGVGLGRPKKLPIPEMVEKKLQSDNVKEQMRSPGVRLVAHAVDDGLGEEWYEPGAWVPPVE